MRAIANKQYQAGFLSDMDKVSKGYHTFFRMLPTQQGFSTNQLVFEIELRLIVQGKLLLYQSHT